MKANGTFLLITGVLLLVLLSSNTANANYFDLSSLINAYGSDKVTRLQNLYNALSNKGLTNLQIGLMLSQALQETGLFTDSPNYKLMDQQNNFAGITVNTRYPDSPNGYADYPDLNSFADDWIYVLSFGSKPIAAGNVNDFNARLKANGYYTASSTIYGNNLNTYFNQLQSTINQ